MGWRRGFDVFVAHSRDSLKFTQKLVAQLESEGLTVYFDERELAPGTPFNAALIRAVETCRVFLFVISERSVQEGSYARAELDWARRTSRTLVAVHAEGFEDIERPVVFEGLTPVAREGARAAQALKAVRPHVVRKRRTQWLRRMALVTLVALAALAAWYLRQRDGVPADMARVEGATFGVGIPGGAEFSAWCKRLGSTEDECRSVAERSHHGVVAVSSFAIDRTEVAGTDFANWIGAKLRGGAAYVPGGQVVHRRADGAPLWQPICEGLGAHEVSRGVIRERASDSPFDPRQAVACVSAAAAAWYCQDQGKRLPTESEWELAAGGAQKRWLPWDPMGSVVPGCDDAVFGRYPGGACETRSHLPVSVEAPDRDVTPEGVRLLGGNVSEWVTSAAAPGSFVARGGSWGALAIDLHPAKVLFLEPSTTRFANVGFRCARSLQH